MKIKIALSCVIIVLAFLLFKSCGDASSLSDANVLLNKKIERTVNSKGEETTKKEALKVDNKILLKELKKSKAVVKNLREKLTKNTRAGFNTTLVTENTTTTKTDSIIYRKDSIFPTYKSLIESKWISYAIIASKDSVRLEGLKIVNEITGVFNERRKFLKPNTIEFELTNHNPFTKTHSMQSFVYKPKTKRYGVSIVVGYGLSSSGLSPFAGVGVTRDIVSF